MNKQTLQAPDWGFCILVGFLSTVALVFGYHLWGCEGIGNAMVMTLLFFMLFSLGVPAILLGLIVSIATISILIRIVCSHGWQRKNLALIAVLLPLVCAVGSFTVACSTIQRSPCYLKT